MTSRFKTKRALEEIRGWRITRIERFLSLIVSCIAGGGLLLWSIVAQGAEVDQLTAQAEFIFKGTLQKVKAATMTTVPITDKTVVVKVDEILQAPEPFRNFVGKEVTVVLSKAPEGQPGDQAIYFTKGWLYGQSIAVVEVGKLSNSTRAAGQAALTAQNEQVTKAVEKLGDKDLRTRVASSDLVVVGKVTSVRPAEAVKAAIRSMRLSEHDPQFLEATIEVERTEKGQLSGNTVKVVFPSSMDVMWYQAPKLKVGQEGAFILHADEAKRVIGAVNLPKTYTVLDSSDFQPKDRQEQLRKVIESLR